MTTKKKYFGTDGIRGKVGESLVTPEFALKLGWAIGRMLSDEERKKVIIGKDTRLSGYMLESALEAGLSSAGIDIKLVGPMPTPGIAYLTQTFRASAGIVISASHNPFYDNGIKFFLSDGSKLSDKQELQIEQYIDSPMVTVASEALGRAMRIDDAQGRYIEFCKSRFPISQRLTGLKCVVDCANGAAYHVGPRVLKELGATVVKIGVTPDGFNINESCGSTCPQGLAARVLEEEADVGIAFDGDGDRVIMVDEKGSLIDGDLILYLIAKSRVQQGLPMPGVVGTSMSNLGLEKAMLEMGVEFFRANVGDRYVSEALRERGWTLGGESSGHIICSDLTTTGDGIISALQVLAAMQLSALPLSELCKSYIKLPQSLINVKTNRSRELLSADELLNEIKKIESELASSGRVLVRASGTEPLLRIMVEGESETLVNKVAGRLASFIGDLEPRL